MRAIEKKTNTFKIRTLIITYYIRSNKNKKIGIRFKLKIRFVKITDKNVNPNDKFSSKLNIIYHHKLRYTKMLYSHTLSPSNKLRIKINI